MELWKTRRRSGSSGGGLDDVFYVAGQRLCWGSFVVELQT